MSEKISYIQQKIQRLRQIEHQLSSTEVASDVKKFKELSQEHAYLSELETTFLAIEKKECDLKGNTLLLKEERDPEMIALLKEDSTALEKELVLLEEQLEFLLVPPDPTDDAPAIVEIRAGTGGEEAALFVADCARMYKMYGDRMGWNYEVLGCTESDLGGIKEITLTFTGKGAYRALKFEAGTHRVQRVPDTETQGRIHTSAITVAVLIEPPEVELVIDEKELRFDTCRASGAGGQHVNKTDSAVRITHLPTGLQVFCQEERSQHKNKEKAMRALRAKLLEEKERKRSQEIASTRSEQVGTGDRSERIRTYNYPQNRVTDHRINLSVNDLTGVMEGKLETFSDKLVAASKKTAPG